VRDANKCAAWKGATPITIGLATPTRLTSLMMTFISFPFYVMLNMESSDYTWPCVGPGLAEKSPTLKN
jgi:hypothetical protein